MPFMTPNASCASTSKGGRSSSRASSTSSMTRMDSLPRSTKERAKWWDTTRRRLDMNGKILEEEYNRNAPYSEQIRIPFLFQGQYYDHEPELAYNRFRYYDPELGRYISEDPIRFDSGTTALHSYVEDTTGWIDIFGLAKSHYNGKRGEARAKHDLERSGFKNIRKQVEMMVNGKRTIADFVAEDGHGKVHVFEVKFGSGRLTENQKSTQAYRRGRNAHANTSKSGGGAIKTSVY